MQKVNRARVPEMSAANVDVAAMVLGMHRSGTSALTHVLSLYGFTLPGTLLPASETNEKGFWESPNVNALNNEIMDALGQTWFSFDAIAEGWAETSAAADFHVRAVALLKEEFGGRANPIIKDPRICRLADFWRDALLSMTSRVVSPIIVRNPLEVAHSLTSRNGFDPELGQLLWLRYYLDAEAKTRHETRAFVNYGDLLSDWRTVVKRLGNELAISTATPSDIATRIDGFLSPDLHHHKVAHSTVLAKTAGVQWLHKAYSIFHGWGSGDLPSSSDFAELDNIRQAMDVAAPAITPLVASARLDRKRLATMQEKASETKSALSLAQKKLEDLTILQQNAKAQTAAIARISEAQSQSRRLWATFSAEQDGKLRSLQEAVDKTLAFQAEQTRIATSALKKAEKKGELFETRYLATREELESLLKEKKLVDQKYVRSQQKFTHAQAKADANRRELERATAQIAQMQNTAAWRVHNFSARLSKKLSFGNLSKQKAKRNRLRFDVETVRASDLFDHSWYLTRYPDVAHSDIDPALHYLRDGWREGRDPSNQFSTIRYLRANPDVEAAGINPLVHFLAHGQSEGRHVADYVPPPVAKSTEDFGPAHPCPRYDIAKSKPLRWIRQASLTEDGQRTTLQLGEAILGYSVDDLDSSNLGSELAKIFELFCDISGTRNSNLACATEGSEATAIALLQTSKAPLFLDGWFVSDLGLRTRWKAADSGEPFVIRAYQLAYGASSPRSVGEGLTVDELDHVDLTLSDPFSPILFVRSRPDGTVIGAFLLPFPSLCRGGLHYAELLLFSGSTQPRQAIDVIGISRELVANFIDILRGKKDAAISSIIVELRGAIGTEPVFEAGFQNWLRHIMHIDLIAGEIDENRDASVNSYLQRSLNGLDSKSIRMRDEGAYRLHLPPNAVPSIRALVALAPTPAFPSNDVQKTMATSFIFAEREAAAEKYLVEMPLSAHNLVERQPPRLPKAFPFLISTKGEGITNKMPEEFVAAIKISDGRDVSPSEMLFPVAKGMPILEPLTSDCKILAVLQYPGWSETSLLIAVEALALQRGSENMSLLFVGDPSALPKELTDKCDRLFPMRWKALRRMNEAWSELQANAVMFMGQNVVLHDNRTLSTLTALLDEPAVITAGCTITSPEEAKKGWNVSVRSSGMVSWADFDTADVLKPLTDLRMLPRSTYAVATHSPDLWMARVDQLQTLDILPGHLCTDALSIPPSIDAKYHLVTSAVSASLTGPPPVLDAHLNSQALRHATTVRIRVLHG